MERLKDWTAKRAGGRITISGKDTETGMDMKFVGVERIDAGAPGKPPVAIDRHGERIELA